MNQHGQLIDLPLALFQLTTVACGGVAAWAALVALLAAWRPTKHLALALTPRLIRAAIFTTVSGAMMMGPAQAGSGLDGLPLPDRGATGTPAQLVNASSPADHVVRAGESLWSIAADALPPDAAAAQVAASSRAWYAANRATVGSDPDLILPGQTLLAPDAGTAR